VSASLWQHVENCNTFSDSCCKQQQGLMSPAPPQAVSTARRHFLEDRTVPEDLVPRPILRSWVRCAGLGLDTAAPPRVEAVDRERIAPIARASRPAAARVPSGDRGPPYRGGVDRQHRYPDRRVGHARQRQLCRPRRTLGLGPVGPGVNAAPAQTQSVSRLSTAGRSKEPEYPRSPSRSKPARTGRSDPCHS
jgi:hypothetical protein